MADMHMAYGREIGVEYRYKTMLGYGFQGFRGLHGSRRMPTKSINALKKMLLSIPPGSDIIMSYTEPDNRIGANTGPAIQKIEEDYQFIIGEIISLTKPKSLIILDWYSITQKFEIEQRVPPHLRVLIRKKQVGTMKRISERDKRVSLDTTFMDGIFENGRGFIKNPALLRDGVHFDYNNPEVKRVLFPRFKSYIERT